MEARLFVDLLPDRSAPTVTARLRRHRGVKIIARDCSTECARAAALGAPGAQQVADRWHLLLNMRQRVERWLTTTHARLRALPGVASTQDSPVRRHASFPRTRNEECARALRPALREEAHVHNSVGPPGDGVGSRP
ncbi:transposase [Pyxidicoccus trucidator]|uniref:transposase n=1 Tax=Pyxidicoccus trucidator TaxID=2709662 RepID=UPI003B833AD1